MRCFLVCHHSPIASIFVSFFSSSQLICWGRKNTSITFVTSIKRCAFLFNLIFFFLTTILKRQHLALDALHIHLYTTIYLKVVFILITPKVSHNPTHGLMLPTLENVQPRRSIHSMSSDLIPWIHLSSTWLQAAVSLLAPSNILVLDQVLLLSEYRSRLQRFITTALVVAHVLGPRSSSSVRTPIRLFPPWFHSLFQRLNPLQLTMWQVTKKLLERVLVARSISVLPASNDSIVRAACVSMLIRTLELHVRNPKPKKKKKHSEPHFYFFQRFGVHGQTVEESSTWTRTWGVIIGTTPHLASRVLNPLIAGGNVDESILSTHHPQLLINLIINPTWCHPSLISPPAIQKMMTTRTSLKNVLKAAWITARKHLLLII